MHSEKTCDTSTLLFFDLQLFAEDGGGGEGQDGGTGGAEATPAGEAVNTSGTNGEKTYTKEDRDAVAKQYGLIPHDAVKERYRSRFEKAGKYDAMAQHMGAVAEKYGVSVDDPEGLAKAILGDRSRIKSRALEMGVSEDVAETVIEAEITKAKEAARVRREEYDRMSQEEAAVKEVYASFDFAKESEIKAFKALVDGGLPMKDAYEMTHHAELTQKAIKAAVEQAKADALAEYKANADRPTEGAAGNNKAGSPTDPRTLKGKELDEFLENYPRRMR